MRTTLINTLLFLCIALIGIALSSADNDDSAAGNIDWEVVDSLYPAHLLSARGTKSRFWKRTNPRKFWKRSLVESAASAMDAPDAGHSQSLAEETY